jgi:four helix bundle protein
MLTQQFPKEERFALTDQIRRSSRAVNAMLAEAWARRRYEAVFVNKISEALGEASETRAWLDHALDCGYLSNDEHMKFDGAWDEIGAMLYAMIDKAESFCGTPKA